MFPAQLLSTIGLLTLEITVSNARNLRPLLENVLAEMTDKVAACLRSIVSRRLSDYATTVEEDRALLQDPSVTGRRRMAVQVRLGEKTLLHDGLDEVKLHL